MSEREQSITAIAEAIRSRQRFVLSSHARPDGDAIGSQMAVALALEAMGKAYMELLNDRTRLWGQMQAYASCDDSDIRAVVRAGYGDLVTYVERVADLPPERISRFFAAGMLLNVIASMGLQSPEEPWAVRLLEGCGK
jgi:hypothetical protein